MSALLATACPDLTHKLPVRARGLLALGMAGQPFNDGPRDLRIRFRRGILPLNV
jgi:hypothetical protein